MRALVAIVALTFLLASDVRACNAPCKPTAQVLIFGELNNGGDALLPWLQQNIPQSTFTQISDFTNNNITLALLQQYDLLITAFIGRFAYPDEAAALASYVMNGGFFFGLSGYYNNLGETQIASSFLADLPGDVSYICAPFAGCVVTGCDSFYPNQQLLAGIPECQIDFDGGYPSVYAVNYTGPGTFSYLMVSQGYNVGLQVDLCSPSTPNAGRYVLWGDEWITFVSRFSAEVGDEQIWKNVLNYLGVCVEQCNTNADCSQSCLPATCGPYNTCITCTDPSCGFINIAPTCESKTVHVTGSQIQLTFDGTSC